MRDAVVEAQFGEIQTSAEYRPAHAKEHRRAKSHPLGMIRTGLVSYLVVRFDGYHWVPTSSCPSSGEYLVVANDASAAG